MVNGETNPPRKIDIHDRARAYAVRAIRLCRHLESRRDNVRMMIAKQYLRAATSIGANLVEGLGSESRRDFAHKCSIAQKEARESMYWLSLLMESQTVARSRLEPLIDETNQLIAILTTIVINTRKGIR